MNDIKKILTDFAKHLKEAGQLKKDTAISDEVKYYLEIKSKNLSALTDEEIDILLDDKK